MCCSLLGKMSEMDSKAMISAWFVWSLKRAPPVKKATAAQRSFEKGPSFKAAFSLSYFWLAAHKSATQTQRDFPTKLLLCYSALLSSLSKPASLSLPSWLFIPTQNQNSIQAWMIISFHNEQKVQKWQKLLFLFLAPLKIRNSYQGCWD